MPVRNDIRMSKEWAVTNYGNVRVEFTPDDIAVIDGDLLTKKILLENALDVHQHLLIQMQEYIPVGATVIDIGAYIGDHTITLARQVGPNGHVIAIEPNPIALFC